VKGQETYGDSRTVPIPPEVRRVVLQYLLLRSKWLKSNSANSKALFFAFSNGYGHLSGNTFRQIKAKIEHKIGEKFEFRDCRRGFGQNYLDKGLNIEAVSVLMGHSSTKTTEGYYCRKSQANAIEEAREVW
jgi:integrase/recombinase XerD